MKEIIINLTYKQERNLYIRAINGSQITNDVKNYYDEFLYFEERSDYYGWLWDIDKLNNLPTAALRGLYWAIHSDEL